MADRPCCILGTCPPTYLLPTQYNMHRTIVLLLLSSRHLESMLCCRVIVIRYGPQRTEHQLPYHLCKVNVKVPRSDTAVRRRKPDNKIKVRHIAKHLVDTVATQYSLRNASLFFVLTPAGTYDTSWWTHETKGYAVTLGCTDHCSQIDRCTIYFYQASLGLSHSQFTGGSVCDWNLVRHDRLATLLAISSS